MLPAVASAYRDLCDFNEQRQRKRPKIPCKVEIMEVDKISNLPGHVIDKILSQLSLRDAARTSILSSKWRYQWATLSSLVFDNQSVLVSSQPSFRDLYAVKYKLARIVDHVLLLHSGPIEKFKLSHPNVEAVSDIDRWILFLSRGSLKELVLDIWKGQRFMLPSSLYLCQNLVHLELYNCVLKPPPPRFSGFKSLNNLDLQHITMDQNAFDHMIYSSPLLERLTLMNLDLTKLEIHARSLSKFFAHLHRIKGLKVQTSFLKYLAAGNVPGRLTTPSLELRVLSLDINFSDLDENLAALCLLRSSPKLQDLEMTARQEKQSGAAASKDLVVDDSDNCLSNQLKIVKVTGISGLKQELDFIKFFLANSSVLKKLIVKPAANDGGWKPLKELMKELLHFARASAQAHIVYLDP